MDRFLYLLEECFVLQALRLFNHPTDSATFLLERNRNQIPGLEDTGAAYQMLFTIRADMPWSNGVYGLSADTLCSSFFRVTKIQPASRQLLRLFRDSTGT
jgi:hypothetical protein